VKAFIGIDSKNYFGKMQLFIWLLGFLVREYFGFGLSSSNQNQC